MSDRAPIDAVVLSASGYAGAEVLRLLAGHPLLNPIAATGHGTAGQSVGALHPHLARRYPGLELVSIGDLEPLLEGDGPLALFGCGPHGASAKDSAFALNLADKLGRSATLVDLSADFRHELATFEALYGVEHPAPGLLAGVHCGLPDLEPDTVPVHACQPGCFTTAVTLAVAPLVKAGLVGPEVHASAITGSTGSGRTPKPGTHHPVRHGNVWGYKPLDHRHAPEMAGFIGRHAGTEVSVHFAPHSGPFARGIAATCFLKATGPADGAALNRALTIAYAKSPFVTVTKAPPQLADVVGTNRCHLHASTDGSVVVVQSVIDNLVKGAAGGAVQWMNRALGWPDATGLDADPLPWS